jgi:hypothetical protein
MATLARYGHRARAHRWLSEGAPSCVDGSLDARAKSRSGAAVGCGHVSGLGGAAWPLALNRPRFAGGSEP